MTKESTANPPAAAVAATALSQDDVGAITELRESYAKVRAELARVIIGQDNVMEQLLICILARGHGLLMGVPGLAKTLMVNSLAQVMSLQFNRIQFTPDLMPSDITGTDILQETDQPGRRAFVFIKGPLFANIILADEINRTPPKTQSALLEAMQEHRVTVAGRFFTLPAPFFVLATQNPIEQEGTYPLPEAQLDRFMFFIHVDYPTEAEEKRIARETTGAASAALSHFLSGEQIIKYQQVVQRVPVPDHIYDLAVELVRRTRPQSTQSPDWLKKWVSWGAGPRAVQYLIRGAKARAVLYGSYLTRVEDLEAVAEPVLTHRILTNFQAQSEGVTSRTIIARLLEEIRGEERRGDEHQLLDAGAIARLQYLPLLARMPMEGSVSGHHKSPHRGSSVEFADYRNYVPGDDIRRLDWRVFARTDRFFMKEFEAETNLRCYLVLDCSGSMNFGQAGATKLDYAKRMAATLGYLAAQQGDATGLICAGENKATLEIPPRRNPAHLRLILDTLQKTPAGGENALPSVLHDLAEKVRRRALVVVISDFFTDLQPLLDSFRHLRFQKHDLAVFQLLERAELDFRFDRPTRFVDLETSFNIVAEPAMIRDEYLRQIHSFLELLRAGCHEFAAEYRQVVIDEPYEKVLADFLVERARLASGP